MLAPFATRTAEFFWIAKLINLATAVALLVSLLWIVTQRYGRWPGLIAALLYALSSSLVVAGSHVNNDSLFVLCVLWMWWFLTAGSDAGTPLPQPLRRWAAAGMCLGLAFLTKSPALLIGLGVICAVVWSGRLRFLKGPQLWVFLATACLVASPLLVRNSVAFGTPVYEGMNSNITWIDSWDEIGNQSSVMYYDRYEITTIESNGLPSAGEYFRGHTARQVATRLFGGLTTEITGVAPRALAFELPNLGRAKLVYGLVVLSFAVAGWWLRRRSWEASLVLFCSGGFLVFFGWNHMFPEIRYLGPLVPIWLMLAAYAMWSLLLKVLQRPSLAQRVIAVTTAVALCVPVAVTLASGNLTNPQPLLTASLSYRELNDWFNHNIERGDRVMIGPTREFHGLVWMLTRDLQVVLTPDVATLPDFLRYLHERKVRYLVLHAENAAGEHGKLKTALAPFVEVSPAGEVRQLMPLPGWRVVHGDDGRRTRFIIYEALER
jgi:4-amino-4-deoxy-L-arabinose transferase-like glycosyltransferase